MTAAWLVPAWVALVVALGWRVRPRPSLALPGAHGAGSTGPALPAAVARAAGVVGGRLRWLARRPADPTADVGVGLMVGAAAAVAVISPGLAVLVPVIGWARPRLRSRRLAKRRADRIADELPEVVDLLLLAAGSGLPALAAVGVVARRGTGPVGTALARAGRLVELGEQPDVAFGSAVAEVGDGIHPLVAALLSSLREGTPLEPALERVGDEARRLRRRRAEEAARRVPVQLLFPLVLCTLPAFALLTVVPLLVSALGSLHA